jgi:hypothetical protein
MSTSRPESIHGPCSRCPANEHGLAAGQLAGAGELQRCMNVGFLKAGRRNAGQAASYHCLHQGSSAHQAEAQELEVSQAALAPSCFQTSTGG